MTVRAVVTASGRVNLSGTGYAPAGEVSPDGRERFEGPLRIESERALAVVTAPTTPSCKSVTAAG